MDSKEASEIAGSPIQKWQCGTCANSVQDSKAHLHQIDQNTPLSDTLFFTSLSLRIGKTVDVRGSTSASGGVVELLSDGTWKGIASVAPNGTFHNNDVPQAYLMGKNILARVRNNGFTSQMLCATDAFVHPRSISVHTTANKAEDQNFYNWNIQWADYQPSGYWIPPFTLFNIWVIGDDIEGFVCIGTQGLAEKRDRSKQTENMLELALTKGQNLFTSGPNGGALHFRNNGSTNFRVLLGPQTEPIPYFVLGQTPPDDWHRMLKESDPMTQVELVGNHVVIAAYADTYRRYAPGDVGEIVRSHEKALEIEAEAAGLDGSLPIHSKSKMWIYAVESMSSFNPHASTGYIALPHGTDPNSEYMYSLIGGQAHQRWVTLHEYGHHFQSRMNSVSPLFNEVSVNIYAAAVARRHKNDHVDVFRQRWPAIKKWLAKPREEKEFLNAPDHYALFEQLRVAFGTSFLTDWNRTTRENPPAQCTLITLTSSLCRAARCNLANFFADWGVIKERDATWQALQDLGLPLPPAGLIDHEPYIGFSDNP